MSEDSLNITGPLTVKRSLNNILAALNIAQSKGAFSIRDSAFIYTSLQKLNEFVNKNEELKEEDVQPQQQSVQQQSAQQQSVQQQSVQQQSVSKNQTEQQLPDINLNDVKKQDSEIIEI